MARCGRRGHERGGRHPPRHDEAVMDPKLIRLLRVLAWLATGLVVLTIVKFIREW